jgi:hypothetical protein
MTQYTQAKCGHAVEIFDVGGEGLYIPDCCDECERKNVPPSCAFCNGPLCEHGICIENWCEHDERCQACAERERRNEEADANAQYYRKIPGEIFK